MPDGYYVDTQDWPVGADDDDLTPGEVEAVLGGLGEYLDAAIGSFRKDGEAP